ncbi:avidin/streptavidin family protein [Pseudomonas fluorescens]|uniref:avidin/streptavidin family protein n=1 Tax=Pseudomonas fluorescens TaxID=294 RepID=UPI0007D076CC|nr:avidin/streptavidin family protein [Pseudomonas fluorescens]
MLRHFSTISTPVETAVPAVDFNGKWRNELHSEMELRVDAATGKVIGTYRTGVGTPNPTEDFDLVGFAAGDLLSFTVNFGKYGSLTSWSGQHTSSGVKDIIKTMWLLAENVKDADEPDKLWGAMLTGADTFHR